MRYLLALAAVVLVAIPGGVAPATAQGPVPPPVYLSEFVSDPEESGNDGAYEWVELANATNADVTLAGWSITDAKLSDAIPEVTIPASGFVVLAGKSAEFEPGVFVVRIEDGLIGGGLNNGEDVIRLLNDAGEEVDRAEYGSGTLMVPPGAGFSMVRKADGGWRLAVLPSPGAPNAPPRDAEIEQRFPIPVEFRTGEQSTSPAAWYILAAAAAGGLAGGVTLLQRLMKRKSHRAA